MSSVVMALAADTASALDKIDNKIKCVRLNTIAFTPLSLDCIQVQSLPWIYNSTLMSPCQQQFDITLQFLYNIFEVIHMTMKPGTKTLSLRIDGELKFELEKEAVKQSRSVNNLLVHIIKQYFENEKRRGYRK